MRVFLCLLHLITMYGVSIEVQSSQADSIIACKINYYSSLRESEYYLKRKSGIIGKKILFDKENKTISGIINFKEQTDLTVISEYPNYWRINSSNAISDFRQNGQLFSLVIQEAITINGEMNFHLLYDNEYLSGNCYFH
ncbi:MAG: hypothetical protein MJK12_09780 [Colwellia sp.]|nr:hypothetical protein [Colwellia sp.]